MKIITIATAVLTVALAAPANASNCDDPYDQIHAGQSRAKVQKILGDTGHRTGMVATDKKRILWKRYTVTIDGETKEVRLTYHGLLCQCGPLEGPYWLHSKKVMS